MEVEVQEDPLVSTTRSLRLERPTLQTAKQVHEALMHMPGWSHVTVSEVKRACSKVAKQTAREHDPLDWDSTARLALRIRQKKGVAKATSQCKRANNHSQVSGRVRAKQRSVGQFVKHLRTMGISADASTMHNLQKRTLPGPPGPRMLEVGGADMERAAARGGGSAGGSTATDDPLGEMDVAHGSGVARRVSSSSVPRDRSTTRRDSVSIARSQSRVGLHSAEARRKGAKLARKSAKKIAKSRRAGESDRCIASRRPKHLHSGKRGIGKTARR